MVCFPWKHFLSVKEELTDKQKQNNRDKEKKTRKLIVHSHLHTHLPAMPKCHRMRNMPKARASRRCPLFASFNFLFLSLPPTEKKKIFKQWKRGRARLISQNAQHLHAHRNHTGPLLVEWQTLDVRTVIYIYVYKTRRVSERERCMCEPLSQMNEGKKNKTLRGVPPPSHWPPHWLTHLHADSCCFAAKLASPHFCCHTPCLSRSN